MVHHDHKDAAATVGDVEDRDDDGGGDGDDAKEGGLCVAALERGFVPSALAHPPTYLNKVVVGSEGGALQLWNVRTGRYLPVIIYYYSVSTLTFNINILLIILILPVVRTLVLVLCFW